MVAGANMSESWGLACEIVDALERADGAAARLALQSDIGRAFELVMHDQRLRPCRGCAA
jgi:DNA-binding GntR family transcriptional regulator